MNPLNKSKYSDNKAGMPIVINATPMDFVTADNAK
jgi:hypothetical protein